MILFEQMKDRFKMTLRTKISLRKMMIVNIFQLFLTLFMTLLCKNKNVTLNYSHVCISESKELITTTLSSHTGLGWV